LVHFYLNLEKLNQNDTVRATTFLRTELFSVNFVPKRSVHNFF
jgi:hypothetical protein